MSSPDDPGVPARVRVTGPRAPRDRGSRPRNVASEIDEQTRLGEIYMSSLLRTQLRLALLVLALLVAVVGAVPLVLLTWPGLEDVLVFGMPLPWAFLGFGIYPMIVGLGWLYVRLAERNEAAFTDVVQR